MRVGHVLKSQVEAIGRLPMGLYSSTVDTEHHALLAPNPQQTGRCRGVASYVKEWSNKSPAVVAKQNMRSEMKESPDTTGVLVPACLRSQAKVVCKPQ